MLAEIMTARCTFLNSYIYQYVRDTN